MYDILEIIAKKEEILLLLCREVDNQTYVF